MFQTENIGEYVGLNFSCNADIGQIGHLWMGNRYHGGWLPKQFYGCFRCPLPLIILGKGEKK